MKTRSRRPLPAGMALASIAAGSFILACLGVCAILLACFLPGCAEQPQQEPWLVVGPAPAQGHGDVALYRDVLFSDIPTPEDYVLDTVASHSFQGSLFRQGMFHFYGGIHWLDALDFYRANLPAAGWTQISSGDRGLSSRVMHFAKGPEKLILVVREDGRGSATEIQLDNIGGNDLLLRGKLPNHN